MEGRHGARPVNKSLSRRTLRLFSSSIFCGCGCGTATATTITYIFLLRLTLNLLFPLLNALRFSEPATAFRLAFCRSCIELWNDSLPFILSWKATSAIKRAPLFCRSVLLARILELNNNCRFTRCHNKTGDGHAGLDAILYICAESEDGNRWPNNTEKKTYE